MSSTEAIIGSQMVVTKLGSIVNPAENLIERSFSLDCSSTANQYIISDFSPFSEVEIKITGLTTAKLDVYENLSSDQVDTAANYGSACGGVGRGVNPYSGTGTTGLGNGSYIIQKLGCFALKIAPSTTAAETAVVLVTMKGMK